MKTPRILGPIKSFFAKTVPWVVFVCLAAAMLFDPGRNTLSVASSVFAVTLALASVTFSYARTMKDASAVRDEVIFAGERMVSGAVLFLVASIVKYASNDVPRYVDALFRALPLPKPPPGITFFWPGPHWHFNCLRCFHFLSGRADLYPDGHPHLDVDRRPAGETTARSRRVLPLEQICRKAGGRARPS